MNNEIKTTMKEMEFWSSIARAHDYWVVYHPLANTFHLESDYLELDDIYPVPGETVEDLLCSLGWYNPETGEISSLL